MMQAIKWPLVVIVATALAGAAGGMAYVVLVQQETPQQETLIERMNREETAVHKSFDSLTDEYRRRGLIQ